MRTEIKQSFVAIKPLAVRVISVPFQVPSSGKIEIASIGDSRILDIPPGKYELFFEHGQDAAEDGMWCNLYFKPTKALVCARVLRADAELSPGDELLMHTEPA